MLKGSEEQAVILVVDDRDDDLVIIKKAFEKARVVNPIITVQGGEEAIQYLKGEGDYSNRDEYPLPSLVLLDLKMPKVDGFEVLEWIRSQPTLQTLRVVVLTSSDHMKDVNRAYALGANSFVTKPVGVDKFLELANALHGYWIWTSSTPDSARPERKAARKESKAH